MPEHEVPDGDPSPPSGRSPDVHVVTPPTRVEHDRIGAVPAFWGTDDGSVLDATLTFRIGEADERLRTRGRCHLVRALVLEDLDVADVQVTGSITTLRTSFTATGSDAGVAAALTTIARRLTALRSDRVSEVVPRILQAWCPPERWDTELMSLRFGSRGYGLSALPLLGLGDLDTAAFDDWVRTWFTARNVVLSANRRMRTEPDLGALGDGITKPLPPPHQLERPYPVLGRGDGGRLAVSFLSRYDAVAALVYDLVIDRIHRRCAALAPGVRRPRSVARRTGPGLATIGVSIELPDDVIAPAYEAISSELFGLAMNGPTGDELDRARIAIRRSRQRGGDRDRDAARRQATHHLFGEPNREEIALRARPEELAKVVRDAVPRAIWMVPPTVELHDARLLAIDTVGDAPVGPDTAEGETWPARRSGSTPDAPVRLVVSADHLSLIRGDGTITTTRFTDIVALESLGDGRRVLWHVNGARWVVDPTDWVDGDHIGTALETGVDPWVVLHRDAGDR